MTTSTLRITATVSGSFRRHMHQVAVAVHELQSLGVRVMSPEDPRIVDQDGEFLYVASDRVRSVRLVQDRHLSCIRHSSFLWLVCPDGYVGPSASMELGFASAARIPVFSTHSPSDMTMRRYVQIVPSIVDAINMAKGGNTPRPDTNLLIDPLETIEEVHRKLDKMLRLFERVAAQQTSVSELYSLSDEISRSFRLTQPIVEK